jgi:glycosyltransferase involved in cell wall biosynthesis
MNVNLTRQGAAVRKAIVVGFDYHVGVLCRKMNAHARSWRFVAYPSSRTGLLRAAMSVRTADALLSFAGPAPHPLLLAAARAWRVPVFVIWAGTDVTRALEQPFKVPHAQRAELIHLAVAPWLVDELREVGIAAQYIPIIGVQPSQSSNIPKDRFSVLTYLPERRSDFYGIKRVHEVARRLPQIPFLVLGSHAPNGDTPDNVQFCGWQQDTAPFMDQSAVVLRVPDHDGMSLMVLEALARGRYVAWKYAIPGVQQVTTSDDTVTFLSALYDRHREGLELNQPGISFIETKYEERQVSLGLEEFLSRSVDAMRDTRSKPLRVAISGLDIFATDIGSLVNDLPTSWTARVLQFDNRYDVLSSLQALATCHVWYTVGTPAVGRSVKMVTDALRIPRVMHWVGTDIEVASRNGAILEAMKRPSINHLTEVSWEAEELHSLGIEATIAPLPPRVVRQDTIAPLPSEFTLLTYIPRARSEFYGSTELGIVMRSLKDRPIKFLIVGGGSVDTPSGVKVESLGWRYSLTDVYERCSALLRFTPRDGLSLMVLEALAFGRYVLWSKDFPFVRQVNNTKSIIANLTDLINRHLHGNLTVQQDAVEFVRREYDRQRCAQRIVAAWDKALVMRRQHRPRSNLVF